ncbi:hypothetical protein GFO_2576 [Christiangramia forsetii KT0803]|uniref:Uncharacterized protein n=3 Tax=Christiangramia forsetii TaxID=411153 RepID=A0M4I7_CHRFK|nr:hypothetical protein GCM10011532_03100 [Christiangramia forsetii]CAL67532.1 hypothetical protein GFO_2576 [Christiangramia forsetii KT0803]
MNTNFDNQALQSISKIYTSAKGKGLETSFFEKLDPELKFLSDKLNISIESAYLFSLIFTQNMENEQVDYSSLAKYLKCKVIDVMSKIEIFKELISRELVAQREMQGRYSQMREEYIINNNIQEAILYNKFPIEKQEKKIKSSIDVLEMIFELAEQCADEEIKPYMLYFESNELLDKNENFPGIRKIKALKLNDRDKAVFLYVLWSSVTGTEVSSMSRTIDGFIRESSRRIKYCQKLISGENDLITKNLIEIEKSNFFNDSGLKLANEGIKLLEEEGIKIAEIDKKDFVSCDSIRSKQLYYNEKEKQNINILS